MMLIPYKMETTFSRIPYSNAAIIILTSLTFFLSLELAIVPDDPSAFVLRDWTAEGLVGSLFLHGGFSHLLGNMIFLWVFGNAICGAVGNISYPIIYLCLGVFAGAVHLMADAHPAIGASGAINGIVGMTLVLFPRNRLHFWYFYMIPILWIFRSGKFAVKTFWMILFWLVFDILGVFGSNDGIGHWAHLGGFLGGMILGCCALWFNLVETHSHTLLDVFAGRDEEEEYIQRLKIEQQLSDHVIAGNGEQPHAIEKLKSVDTANNIQQANVEEPVPASPEIQLLRCVSNDTMVTCYIVNKGAAMSKIAMKVPQNVTVQMRPASTLSRGESGWIRFTTNDNVKIDSIEFIIRYELKNSTQQKIRFKCIPERNLLEVVSIT